MVQIQGGKDTYYYAKKQIVTNPTRSITLKFSFIVYDFHKIFTL
ncbi:hypothetical protein HMPREF0765_4892 [Sphingobacterium spiritivorum ATCC 33300]|uniref:Uncharacterized protein n=1 Tax=Sphingobacterium spiritivorum ATCC 33300 TaxID=525372 RepID=C2G5N6_SPHSI|nr:hypothetical protein HMPREF0765_4892 [Sphingobacterium spiritivorum ATCC 33300]